LSRFRPGLFVACLALAAAPGCSSKIIKPPARLNVPPTVTLTQAPINDGSAYFYAYRLNWSGYDVDGRVESYVYAVDPPLDGSPIPWTPTTKNEQTLFFTAGRPDSSAPLTRAIDFHTFAIRAIDNDGDSSEVVTRSFFSFTAAPTVNVLSPRPNALVVPQFSPSIRIQWSGTDPDGQFNTRPVRYKYTLLGPSSEFPLDLALSNPDSLRRYYAPSFAGWDSVGGDTTEARYANLTPGVTFLFVVVAFDEAGAYSPLFTLNNNMLRFRVGFAGALGPKITMFNETFFYEYSSGGYSTDRNREVFIEVPVGNRVTFNWFATPQEGTDIASYRWALDIADVGDNTPRSNEETDVHHWSAPSLLVQSATVGPFAGGEEHRFYIEATDSNGLRSLGIVRFPVIQATLEKPLVIVDDTRFIADQMGSGGCVRPPLGVWPTAAELDTFLFAVGNTPWRCYPAGTITPPGLFAGYAYDTLGTRTGSNDGTLRLSTISKYAHLVWVIDAVGATNFKVGSNPFDPITSLRFMSSPGNFNSLGAYVKQGGKVWLTGGGGAYATLIPWNKTGNDGGGITWSNTFGELIPGRFMYDLAAWRSEIKVVSAPVTIRRFLGRNQNAPPPLPPEMRKRTAANSPFPPGRAGQGASLYYRTSFDIEFLSRPNLIWEDVDPDPDVYREESTLDTLYEVVSFALPATSEHRVVMTWYHPIHQPPFMFTGFSNWDFVRQDCQDLVDYVLRDVWGLPKQVPPQPRAAVAVPATERGAGRGALKPGRGGAENP